MKLSVAPLFSPQEGKTSLRLEFSEDIVLPQEWNMNFMPVSPFEGELEIIRMDEDVLVFLRDAHISGETQCVRCLGIENIELSFSESEQIYSSKKPDIWGEESFWIDPKGLTIDLSPFFLQEIATQIPSSFVHEEGKCDPEMLQKINSPADTLSPLSDLKDLFKDK